MTTSSRRYSRSFSKLLLGSAAVCSAFVWAPDASSDEKNVSAAVCKPVKGQDPAQLYIDQFGRVYNLHQSNSLEVICPLVRDTVFNLDGVHSGGVAVDNPTTNNLACGLFSLSEAGTILQSDIQSTGQTSDWDVLVFDEISPVAPNGTYHVLCQLPGHGIAGAPPPIKNLAKVGSIKLREHS
jgi:hypothetical protein